MKPSVHSFARHHNGDPLVQVTYFLLRIVAGLLFIQTGGLILFGWFGGIPGQPGTPSLLSQTGIGGILEFFGGIAVVLGLGTRPVAFILSGMMAVAYWQFHAPNGLSPVQNQGMPAVLFPLPLHGSARRWRLEPRRAVSTQTPEEFNQLST
jgi:putative oxidoreductase